MTQPSTHTLTGAKHKGLPLPHSILLPMARDGITHQSGCPIHSECECDSRGGYGLPDTAGEATRYGLAATFPAIEMGMCNSMDRIDEGRVERLVLTMNNMHGSLPAELSLLTSMRVFVSLGNPIGITIPSEFGLLPNLEFLGLALGDLKGSIPSQLARATNLTHLVLLNNQLSRTR